MPEFPEAGLLALVSALAASLYLLRWKKHEAIPLDCDCNAGGRATQTSRHSKYENQSAIDAYVPKLIGAISSAQNFYSLM